MTSDKISRQLFGPGINSEDRVRILVMMLLNAEDTETFWKIVSIGWNTCDRTWMYQPDLLIFMKERGSAAEYLEGRNKEFYDSLPALVTIYRGCSLPFVRGMAWTTNRSVAKAFASGHRGIPVRDAVIATALIPKDAIFTVMTDRNEDEVVINWRRLRRLTTQAWQSREK